MSPYLVSHSYKCNHLCHFCDPYKLSFLLSSPQYYILSSIPFSSSWYFLFPYFAIKPCRQVWGYEVPIMGGRQLRQWKNVHDMWKLSYILQIVACLSWISIALLIVHIPRPLPHISIAGISCKNNIFLFHVQYSYSRFLTVLSNHSWL